MMKKLLAVIPLLLLSLSLVLAAGGGGGGGGGSTGRRIIPSYLDLKCDDHGTLIFTRSAEWKPVMVTAPSGEKFAVPGNWGYNKFISEESALAQIGEYIVNDPDHGDRKVTCPGVRISCAWAKLQVKECTPMVDGVTVIIAAVNVSTSYLKYQFSLPGTRNTLSYQKGSFSPQLAALSVTPQDATTYLVSIPLLSNVTAFEVSIPDCIGRKNIYARKECTGAAAAEEPEAECGGYMGIKDRVKCRLHLSPEERKEAYNFFPEECRIRSDAQACLETYEAVQECWDFPNGEARINCARRVLKLGDFLTEKANCNALDAGKRDNCNRELQKKGYNLIKFRFYNLEQEAEKMMNEGKLNEDVVTNFIVTMEQNKAAFNLAKTKRERKEIIQNARKEWLLLVRMVKS